MATIERLDQGRQQKLLYTATDRIAVVDVPAMPFLMIDGIGDPNTSRGFAAATEALYGVSYALKFAAKRSATPVDYKVMPLEALWWADDMGAFLLADRDAWRWTLMIAQPDFTTVGQVEAATAAVRAKKSNPSLELLRFATLTEGRAAQLLHIGPYSAETANIQRLHAFIAEQGGRLSGKHHEIYLSDARRTAPAKLKTIIRQPFTV